MREWLSGGAPPCQGGGRGFDPRLALEKRTIPNRYRSFFRALPGLESSMSTLRSGPRFLPLDFSKGGFFMLHQINFYCSILSAYLMR